MVSFYKPGHKCFDRSGPLLQIVSHMLSKLSKGTQQPANIQSIYRVILVYETHTAKLCIKVPQVLLLAEY